MKRNNWFVDYELLRDLNFRKKTLIKSDFLNCSVIDVGCNFGQLSRYASDCGAKYVLGVDFDDSVIIKARELSKEYNNIDFLTDDIDNYIFYTNLPNFDTCLFMSVIGTKELKNRYGILSRLSAKTLKTMYIEGHYNVFRKIELLKSILNYTTFTSIEYLGPTYDNAINKQNNISRDIFRCSRKIYTEEETLDKFVELLHNTDNSLIAIQGHGGTGKSTLNSKLINHLNTNTKYKFDISPEILNRKTGYYISKDASVCIIDDIEYANLKDLMQKHKYIIYFDYMVLEYAKDYNIDTLFIFNYNINSRFHNRPCYLSNRTPDITQFIKNIYHIDQYDNSDGIDSVKNI